MNRPQQDAGGGAVSKTKSTGSTRSTRTTDTQADHSLLAGYHPRRPVISRSPESFRRLAVFHICSGILAIVFQAIVTGVVVNLNHPKHPVFHDNSSQAQTLAKASIGIIAGCIYICLGLYGLYMSQNIFTLPFDVLKERLWLFNVLNGATALASMCLFGAGSYLAKSSAVWFSPVPTYISTQFVLAANVILTVVAAFEVCVGAAGVFMK
ncbi:uncharacterized protein LOC129596461 [Paramacrobiotus metropolitanus]|uniref:uncharacterized protein LOC129596461 n=1 Tax=Paramacrobiotus metropolitanus TaxID=2943436 RepID=UPI0024456DCE|nr:uncharacterized protein LOC129596461 [Paramacrobiotus metropolitanus]